MSRGGTAKSFAVLLALAGVGTACQTRKDPPAGAPGEMIYELQNCANCHGKNGEGNMLGPPLAKLTSNWSAERLVAFLTDPEPVLAADERLRTLAGTYSSQMTRYDNLTEEQRRVLADWLLARHP